ncbi:MAG: sugar ABC transporter substrate-binding protein, partial [Clostridiales bacterium]|nr:sugar ABC transporter substrate-binding protein [Clostridiales bacterium]
EVIPQLEEQTGIKIEHETYTDNQVTQKLTTEFAAGVSSIDIFNVMLYQNMSVFENNDWLEPLDSFINDPVKSEGLYWEDFEKVYNNVTNSKGQIVGIPIGMNTDIVYYRKDILEKAGYTEFPKTYEEFEEMCQTVNDPDNNFYAFTARGEAAASLSSFSSFLYSYGGYYLEDGECAINTDVAIEAMKFYGKLLNKYGPPGVLNMGISQISQVFSAGQTACAIDTVGLNSTLSDPEQCDYADVLGIAPTPEGPKGRVNYSSVPWSYCMYKGSEKKDAAWEVLKFLTSREVYAKMPSLLPARQYLYDNHILEQSLSPEFLEAVNINTVGAYYTNLPDMSSVLEARDIIGQVITYSIQTAGEGPELKAKADEAKQKVDDLLKESGEYKGQ